jgi:DNA polymerase-3 subunit delta'
MPFRDVVGHARLTDLLVRAVARDTVPPTLLFAGPDGVGKWRVAVALAQAVNCLSPDQGDACGVCRACDRIARGVHVDAITLAPAEPARVTIDGVREVLERSAYRPFEGRRRVVAVRDADALSEATQNALLKSLEEPPPATMFVLTSAAPDALLRTVRSRTMRLTFGRLTTGEIADILVRDHGQSPQAARAAAALADGSAGAALAIGSTDLDEARAVAQQLLHAAGAADLSVRIGIAKAVVGKPERTRQELAAILRVASSIVRDLAVVHAGSDRRLLANADLGDAIDRLARILPPPAARRAFGTIDRALTALERNGGIKVVAEWVAAQL